MEEDPATCTSCFFRLRFGFRRSLYHQLFLSNAPLVTIVRKLGIKRDADVARIMRVFKDVDIRGTHKLDIEMFFGHFGIEFTEYNNRAFRLLAFGEQVLGGPRGSEARGVGGESIYLNFDQFFVSMYNYGTLIHESLVRFAFDVMASGKEWCNRQDVLGLVALLHSDVKRVKETTSSLMAIMDPHNRDKDRREEKRLGSMMFPAFKLQKILRAKVLGQWYWRRATKKRRKARLMGVDLCREYTKLKEEQNITLKAGVGGRELGGGGTAVGTGEADIAGGRPQAQGEGGVLDSAVPVANDGEEYRPETGYQAHNQNEDEDGASTSTESTRDRNSQDERKEELSQQEQQQQPQRRRRSSMVGVGRADGTQTVSYADNLRRSFTASEGAARRQSVLQAQDAQATDRRRSVSRNPPDGNGNNNDGGVGSTNGRRRSTVKFEEGEGGARQRRPSAKPLVPSVPGRRGSIFEDMQVFDPSPAPAQSRRRSSVSKALGPSTDAINSARRRSLTGASKTRRSSRVAAGKPSANDLTESEHQGIKAEEAGGTFGLAMWSGKEDTYH